MHHVVALFRVLHVTDHGPTSSKIASIAPTYATRDGQPSERNKSFSKWTPSGSGSILLASPAALELFVPDAYVNLDIRDEETPEVAGAIRTDWQLAELRLQPQQFVVDLQTHPRAGERNRNSVLHGTRYGTSELKMTVTNLAALPLFRFEPTVDGMARRFVIDFSPG